MKPKKIKLDLGFANLVVEVYNSDYPVPEVIIYLDDGKNMQDIAIVRETKKSTMEEVCEHSLVEVEHDAVECLVYSDENDEDYTHKFTIGHYKYEE